MIQRTIVGITAMLSCCLGLGRTIEKNVGSTIQFFRSVALTFSGFDKAPKKKGAGLLLFSSFFGF
jgi:hypothetical protein